MSGNPHARRFRAKISASCRFLTTLIPDLVKLATIFGFAVLIPPFILMTYPHFAYTGVSKKLNGIPSQDVLKVYIPEYVLRRDTVELKLKKVYSFFNKNEG